MVAILGISFNNSYDFILKLFGESEQGDTDITGQVNITYLLLSILCFLLNGFVFACSVIGIKYAKFYYRISEDEFLFLTRAVGSALVSSTAIVYKIITKQPLIPD